MKQALDRALADADVPGIVGLVTDPDETRYTGAAGNVDVDTPHAIMSMTKPVTSVAIMRLVEAGELEMDTPAEEVLPAYKDLQVAAAVDFESGKYEAVPQHAPFTTRQLLTHTAGFGYAFGNPVLAAIGTRKDTDILCHQPAERWTYGTSTSVLGEMVAAIRGKSLGDALEELVFDPLGMRDTSYEVKDNQAVPHHLTENGWHEGERYPVMPYGDAGLISTVADYAKFVRCLLNGAPLLSADMHAEMVSNQIGDLTIETVPSLNPAINLPFPRGAGIDKWGLGFQLHVEPPADMRNPGSFSWCGLLNTHFWCDPQAKIGGIVFMQSLPFYSEPCMAALDRFEGAVYAGLS